MSKYAPLKTFLASQSASHVPMTFHEIEDLLGIKLPESKRYPAWWSNNPSNNVMTKVWLDAGFMTEQVDIGGERLVFRRAPGAQSRAAVATPPTPSTAPTSGLLGRLRKTLGGTVRFAPGFDPTTPTGETWDADRG